MRLRVLLPLALAGALAGCGDKDGGDTGVTGGDTADGGGGAAAALDCASAEGVRFTAADGSISDWTAAFAAGADGAPALITVEEDGVVDVCGGTWFVALDVSASDLVLRGDARVSAPVLDGGGSGPLIQLRSNGARFVAEDLSFTGALACFGSVLTAADMAEPCDQAAQPLDADITFRRSHLYANAYELGGGVVGVSGGLVLLEDSLVAANEGHGVFGIAADITCTGSSAVDAGVMDNSKTGVWIADPGADAGYALVSAGCDWGGNGQEDVRLDGETYFDGFGADASFSCDARSLTCE
jgi:hypothetical protein